MQNFLTKLITVAAMSAGLALAQTADAPAPSRGQRHIEWLSSRLNLTDAQQTQAQNIFATERQNSKPVMQQLRAAEKAVQDAAKANPSDPQIDTLAAGAGNLQSQLIAIRARAMGAFYNILTAEQKQQFDQFHQNQQGRMPHGAFGGHER